MSCCDITLMFSVSTLIATAPLLVLFIEHCFRCVTHPSLQNALPRMVCSTRVYHSLTSRSKQCRAISLVQTPFTHLLFAQQYARLGAGISHSIKP